MYTLVALISFGASVVGAICGIGGGVIIKPLLDALGILSVPVISFLSGCTVLTMSVYSVLRRKLRDEESGGNRTLTYFGPGRGGGRGARLRCF